MNKGFCPEARGSWANGAVWRIEVWPSAPETVNRDIRRRQWLYTGMLLLMLASLLFGIVSNARTVRKQLEVARMKSDFVSAVSHEFRSPLTGIRQLAEMLGSGRVTNEERKTQFYGMIGREAERLTHLVENALGFARATDRTNRYHFERIETVSWLRETLERFQQSPAGREIQRGRFGSVVVGKMER